MAVVSVTVPDSIVPNVVAALQRRYPDLAGLPAADVGRAGVARILRETLQNAEMEKVERDLQAQLQQARADRLASISTALTQIV